MASVPTGPAARVRVGRGDVVPPDVRSGQADLIEHFLGELSELVPESVTDLTTRPFDFAAEHQFTRGEESARIFLSCLADAWVERWRVSAHWAKGIALHNLTEAAELKLNGHPPQERLTCPGWRDPYSRWLLDGGPADRPYEARLPVEYDIKVEIRTSPVSKPWDEVARDAREEFERQLHQARLRYNVVAKLGIAAFDLVSSVTKTTRHLRWLVRYQVQGASYGEIGRTDGPEHLDAQTVKDGVQSAARLLSLRLRPPDRGGRPRKLGENQASGQN